LGLSKLTLQSSEGSLFTFDGVCFQQLIVALSEDLMKGSQMDLAAGIASAKAALDIAKTLKNINKSYDEASLKADITALIEKLSDARIALVEAKEGIFDRDREIESLKNAQAERKNLIKAEGGYLYRLNEGGKPEGFPICPKCDAKDSRLVNLVEFKVGDHGQCPVCDSEYSPVTCYLADGSTLKEQQVEKRKRRTEELNRRIANLNRDSNWMA
jgi:hypothetical protein